MCIVRKRGADRIRRGHLWIYRSDIKDTEGAAPGSIVSARDERGNVLGKAFYSSKSQIALRFLSRSDTAIDDSFFKRSFEQPDRLREKLGILPTMSRPIYSDDALVLRWSVHQSA